MSWRDLKEKGISSIGGAVSGGLDSCTITHWLSEKGFKVFAYTVDLGQPDEESLAAVGERMKACGAVEAHVIPAQDTLAKEGLKVIQAQAKYEGGYWNTTGIARPMTTRAVLAELQKRDIGVLFHGATGRGNDQVRFQFTTNTVSPQTIVYAPWRDPEFVAQFPGRTQMIDYCQKNNLPIKPRKVSRYSTDANFLGLTHEAGDLERVDLAPTFVEPGMGVWPWKAPDQTEIVAVRWEQGIPVALNGKALNLIEVFKEANRIGGKHGVGIGNHVIENRFVGVKSRGIYEAPGMELLGKTYEYLLQFILDRRAVAFYSQVSTLVAVQIYQGYWLDLATTAALAALEPINKLATGTISVRLFKGGIYFDTAVDTPDKMPYSLYTDDSSMEAMGSYDHKDAEGFLKVLGVSARNYGIKQFPIFKR